MTITKSIAEYCRDNILVLPQALKEMKDATCLMQHGASCIFYKNLAHDLINVEFFSNSPCFVFIKNGKEIITSTNDTPLEMTEGTATLLPQGINLHSDYVRTSGRLKAYLLFFDDDIVQDFLRSQRKFGQSSVKKTSSPVGKFHKFNGSKALDNYFESLTFLSEHDLCSPELLRLKMLEFLQILALTNAQTNAKTDEVSHLATVLSCIKTISTKRNVRRLMQKPEMLRLTVADLAKISGRSLSSFNRDFRASYDMPPQQWLKQKRLAHAQELLTEKDLSVTEVSLEIGYENVSHFIKSFKDFSGLTPKEYRAKSVTQIYS